MNKSLLILETPQTCYECMFCENGRLLSYCCKITESEFEFINGEIKSFCPLKQMPQKQKSKMDHSKYTSDYFLELAVFNAYDEGYNACIDEIIGKEQKHETNENM